MKTRLKELRARDGLNQTELARLAKVSRQTICMIEREELIPSLLIRKQHNDKENNLAGNIIVYHQYMLLFIQQIRLEQHKVQRR